jgi:hypothetical protein
MLHLYRVILPIVDIARTVASLREAGLEPCASRSMWNSFAWCMATEPGTPA